MHNLLSAVAAHQSTQTFIFEPPMFGVADLWSLSVRTRNLLGWHIKAQWFIYLHFNAQFYRRQLVDERKVGMLPRDAYAKRNKSVPFLKSKFRHLADAGKSVRMLLTPSASSCRKWLRTREKLYGGAVMKTSKACGKASARHAFVLNEHGWWHVDKLVGFPQK